MEIRGKRHLRALTGIRFFAAIWIVVHHYGTQYLVSGPAWAYNLAKNGYFLVDLFFILSGFVIAYTYLDAQSSARINLKNFWIARIARLYPIYLFALMLSILVYLTLRPIMIASPFSFVGISTYVFMLQAWLPSAVTVDFAEFPNPPAWAVSAELFFYFVFPFIAPWVSGENRKKLILSIVLLFVVNTIVLGVLSIPGGKNIPLRTLWTLPEFLIGIALGKLYLIEVDQARQSGKFKMEMIRLSSIIAFIGILILLSLTKTYMVLVGTVIPLFGILVYCLAHGIGPIGKIFSHPLIYFLGQASYCIYILQDPVQRWAQRIVWKWPILDVGSSTYFLAYFLVLIIFSILVLNILEKPARNIIRKLIFDSSNKLSHVAVNRG